MNRLLTAAAAIAAALLAIPAVVHWRERPPAPVPPARPLRSTWIAPGGLTPGAGAEYSFGLSLAPDGRLLVYPAAKAGVATLWLHDLSTSATRELPGTDGAAMPFWSADATRIGFFSGGKIRAIELSSGTTFDLAEAASPRGAAWNAAGDLIFAPSAQGGLMRRSVAGSIAPFTTLDTGETAHTWPAFLDDGHVVFHVSASQPSRSGIWVTSLDNPPSRKRVMSADGQAVVPVRTPRLKTQDPRLLYLNDVALMLQALDPVTHEAIGRAVAVGAPAGRGALGQVFATATDDVLIYGPPGTALRELRWFSRTGQVDPASSDPIDAWDLRIAPDGRRFVVTEIDRQLRTLDVFIRTGAQPAPTRLSLSTDVDESGVWSPDGLRVAWAGQRRKVMIRGAGAVLPEQTIAQFDTAVQVWDWSRDGRSLLIGRRHADTGDDLWIQPPTEGASAQPYATAPFDQAYGAFSPDGRAIAYASNESGQFDVYVDTYPKPGSRVRVTTAGGTEPRWAASGRELYFRRGSEIHAVQLDGRLQVQSVAKLIDAGQAIRAFDVSPDGRFLLNLPAANNTGGAATLVAQWRPAMR